MKFETLLYNAHQRSEKLLAVLIDPEKIDEPSLLRTLAVVETIENAVIFVGGSMVQPKNSVWVVNAIKKHSTKPCVLFPGNPNQITYHADAILYLSLISGRNPDYLIGHHVNSALELKKSKLEVIPTGYILIDGGRVTSVHYVSNTLPIPSDKTDLLISTAVAGELLGLKAIYLDSGSGALAPVSGTMIQAVRENTSLPIIVGGGIASVEDMQKAFDHGADVVVIGTAIEKDVRFLTQLKQSTSLC